MKRYSAYTLGLLGLTLLAGEMLVASQLPVKSDPAGLTSLLTPNVSGISKTVFTGGTSLDLNNPFFKSLGTNGRSCVTCHAPQDGWTITPASVQLRFLLTGGTDPIFHSFDGTNSPNADQSNFIARYQASTMLLNKGLIRVGIGIPSGADFTLDAVDDPYGYANASELSLFRRPMPSANLRFLTGVMWDGRESAAPDTMPISPTPADPYNQASLLFDLGHQANDATLGHARSIGNLTPAQKQAIVNFEMGIIAAQQADYQVGALDVLGGQGGADYLSSQNFYVSINDVLGADIFHKAFNRSAMTAYNGWANSSNPRRAQVARGQTLFNTKPIRIVGVAGLNDALNAPVIAGTCTTCHDSPNVGNHSVALPIDIGLSDASRRTTDMPLYTLRNKSTGATVQTTDPGRALITGKWQDIGKFKGAVLRNLACRAPYFHNGLAANLDEVVDFYNTRFQIGFTAQEKADLVAFLKTL